ncbi:hypothetical protein RRG59_04280 [Mycoplasmopsis felis]|nr:hypothetical protein [Mycoplasmopsis felis]WQQ05078.1 hypothetical protein RRG55_01835 [Mycoplasmopsis felis]
MHLGHALDSYIPDTIIRYKKLKGFDVILSFWVEDQIFNFFRIYICIYIYIEIFIFCFEYYDYNV